MVDQEVVAILAEIKQRVVSAKSSEPLAQTSANSSSLTSPGPPAQPNHDYASMAVLARAWDRLPPLVTNRTGTAAKIDLWIKGKLKTALRWFTWEQVNFNAATHQNFKELIETLAWQQQQLTSIQNQLQKLVDGVDGLHRSFDSTRSQNEELRAALNTHEANLGVLRALVTTKVENLVSQHAKDFDAIKSRVDESQARWSEIVRELREGDEKILDEQRVSFKQLSFELSEAQVLQDRARRELDARVAKFEK
jgi:septation ring formation regulator EzrA